MDEHVSTNYLKLLVLQLIRQFHTFLASIKQPKLQSESMVIEKPLGNSS